MSTFANDLDIRSRWLGIKKLRSTYSPRPYHLKNKEGITVPLKERAKTSAQYLSNKQWAAPTEEEKQLDEEERLKKKPELFNNSPYYDISDIEQYEVYDAINTLKKRKAPGPDGITNELIQALQDTGVAYLTELYREWWNHKKISTEATHANVFQIFKKGSTVDPANYRPISLLNVITKIYAKIIHKRLAEAIDPHLTTTQFGFRKSRSTHHAIHIVRRIIEAGESTTNKLIMVLLDWEKAFDRLRRVPMEDALRRAGIPKALRLAILSLYEHTTFEISATDENSPTCTQHSGIRQGCPLSPYLFIIIMTVFLRDVKINLTYDISGQRVAGGTFDEILFAGDTILISHNTRHINLLIKTIEK